ncbi:MAG: 2-oxo acid dehydrogenase subunit E2 [Betaproteobacteria bacterium]|nr:MAG: 2-oxo acid dehydrogenase subunit E2 [Betaproteobacteria bacterium]
MSVRKLLMPKLGLTMTEGTVIEWPIAVGGTFARGEVCVVVETDKVANEIEAPEAGRLLNILVPAGDTVPVGSVLAEWETEAKQSEAQAGTAVAPTAAVTPVAAAGPEPVRRKAGASELAAARRLTAAKQNIPHFYLSTEIEVSALQAQRAQWNADAARPKLTLTYLFLAALACTLAAQPKLNRIWDDEYYVELPGVDLGVAVNTERGLTVPVLRNADRMDLGQLATAAAGLVARARGGELSPHEVGGGAITLSNAGMFDVTYMGSIINPGQAAILGVGSERRRFRPDESGAPRLVREIGVVLSCDHRVLDGVRGLQLLNGVRERLELPAQLFA